MKHGIIEITLRSDLCPGTGYAFSGTIDSDVSYDKNGIPYIPARRLKGVFRENAGLLRAIGIDKKRVKKLFGEGRHGSLSGMIIENAYPAGYKDMTASLAAMKKDPKLKRFLLPQSVLGQYTSVRAQTRLEDGIADDNSLRFTRVVNQYDFSDTEKPMQFFAGVQYPEDEEDVLEKVIRATRNIGLNRNRGLGSVRMRLVPQTESYYKESNTVGNEKFQCKLPGDCEKVYLFFRNEEPLMISEGNNLVTETYIPGKAVLGAFAAAYLSMDGKTADDCAFRDLFLNGKTRFSNLCISDGKSQYYPAPAFIGKMKKSGKLVNSIALSKAGERIEPGSDYDGRNGNQPKKLKGKYVSVCGNKIEKNTEVKVLPVETKIVFHHAGSENAGGTGSLSELLGDRSDEENGALLYSQQVISEGQIFSGTIEFPAEYSHLIEEIINRNEFRFGKSKTAQYGKSSIFKVIPSGSAGEPKKNKAAKIPKGSVLLVSLDSDAVFENEKDYTVRFEEVYRYIARDLGIENSIEHQDNENAYSLVSVSRMTGYSGIWNLRKPAIPVIEAGSTFAFVLKESVEIDHFLVGKKKNEGCGRVSLYYYPAGETPYRMKEENPAEDAEDDTAKRSKKDAMAGSRMAERILSENIGASLYRMILARDISGSRMSMSTSTIGRITLMLKESQRISENNPEGVFEIFYEAVNSIDRKTEKNEILKILRKYIAEKDSVSPERILYADGTGPVEKIKGIYDLLQKTVGREEAQQTVSGWWPLLLEAILTENKYAKKFE